jgi:DNA-binding HxlR family transcriptional regulator
LRRLAAEGVLVARPYSRRPPRAVYELTADGRELAGALRELAGWGARRSGRADDRADLAEDDEELFYA